MEKFSVNVNVAANTSVIFTLTHEELLQRVFGKYELMIRVKPKQLVHHFEVLYFALSIQIQIEKQPEIE